MTGTGSIMDGQTVVSVIDASIPNGVRIRLEAANSSLLAHDLIILPPYERGGADFYGQDDVYALRLARDAGLDAAYLHDLQDRDYLQEYSAGWAVEFAIAFSANVASVDFVGISSYVIARARQAVSRGLHVGPADKVPVRITVANYHRESTGELTLKGLKIEGSADAAAEALRILVDPHPGISGQQGAIPIESRPDTREENSGAQIKDQTKR